MKIGIVTDEISLNINESLNYCKDWDINLVELRCLESGRVPFVKEEEIQKLIELKKKYNIRVTAISPGLFKIPINEKEKIRNELDNTLPICIQLCEKVETKMIICFGFPRYKNEPETNFNDVVDYFGETALKAEKYGLKISVENEPGFWCDSGKNTAKIIETVNMKNFGCNWDPANAIGTNEKPFPDGYNFIKKFISNVHVKDARISSLIECFPIGEGIIDWDGQIKSLMMDHPVEHVTIETHCLPLVEKSKINLLALRSLIEKYRN